MYYRQERTVAYYECDVGNRLKPSGALQYMQQTSSEQLASLQQSPEQLYEQGMVFLLVKTNLKIERMPLCGERISIGTAAVDVRGPRFIREFVLDSHRGERLISAYSLWVLTDTVEHRIMRPNAYPYSLDLQESQLKETVGDIRIPKAVPGEETGDDYELEIRYSHLDVNRHLNNCIYADLICDALPYPIVAEKQIATLALSFQQEARQGDRLQIKAAPLSPLSWKVRGIHERGSCFEALTEWKD